MTPDPHDLLRERFGLSGFRPGQLRIIRAVRQGRDALGIMPTGGGKSLCFQMAALLLPRCVLVVSPLIALMRDQVRRARSLGLRAAALHSALTATEQTDVATQAFRAELDLLYLAPERMASPRFPAFLESVRPSAWVVDEAHCISGWGHDFRPDYRWAGRWRTHGVAALGLTATATPAVRADIEEQLGLQDPVRVVTSFDRPNLWWSVRRFRSRAGRLRALTELRRDVGGAVLVYAPTRNHVDRMRRALAERGILVRGYHAGLPSRSRASVEQWFTDERAPTLVATNAFGMGIDRPDVRAVIHIHAPPTLEALYQEAGRAGRDGEPARVAIWHVGRFRSRTPSDLTQPKRLRRLHAALVRQWLRAGRTPLAWDAAVAVAADQSLGPQAVVRLRSLGALRRVRSSSRSGSSDERVVPLPGGWSGVRAQAVEDRLEAGRRALDRYLAGNECRRRTILKYFGEEPSHDSSCHACDVCERLMNQR